MKIGCSLQFYHQIWEEIFFPITTCLGQLWSEGATDYLGMILGSGPFNELFFRKNNSISKCPKTISRFMCDVNLPNLFVKIPSNLKYRNLSQRSATFWIFITSKKFYSSKNATKKSKFMLISWYLIFDKNIWLFEYPTSDFFLFANIRSITTLGTCFGCRKDVLSGQILFISFIYFLSSGNIIIYIFGFLKYIPALVKKMK